MINQIRESKEKDPRYKLAQILLEPQTKQITHPMEGVANLARAFAGKYQMDKLENEYKMRENSAEDTLAGALDAYTKSQQGGTTQLNDGNQILWNKSAAEEADKIFMGGLSSNKDTQDLAVDYQLKEMEGKRALSDAMEKIKLENSMKPPQTVTQDGVVYDVSTGKPVIQSPILPAGSSKGGITVDPATGQLIVSGGQYDSTQTAQAMGVPSVALDTRGMSGKDASMFAKQTRIDAQKKLTDPDYVAAAQQARQNQTDSKRFEELMKNQDTGGVLINTPGIGWAMKKFDPELSEMASIQDRLTPQQREPGSGSTSNFDAQMFQNALFGPDKPEQTNQAIITANKARAADTLNYQSFLSDFLNANGHINGADKAWQEYLDSNPIFDPASPQVPQINPNRKPYQEYFGIAQPTPAQTQESGEVPNGLTPEEQAELDQLRKRFGR